MTSYEGAAEELRRWWQNACVRGLHLHDHVFELDGPFRAARSTHSSVTGFSDAVYRVMTSLQSLLSVSCPSLHATLLVGEGLSLIRAVCQAVW